MTPSVRRALQLLPPSATTGIGSLPHTQLELGLQMALQVDVPYLPQLPVGHPNELMIASALDGFPGLSFDADGLCTIDLPEWEKHREELGVAIEGALQTEVLSPYEPSPQSCRAFRPFLWEVENRKLPFAKVQIAGPATVRWVTRTSKGEPACEVAPLDQQIFRFLMAKALAMARAVRRAGATPIVYLDDSGLYAFSRRNPRHLLLLQEIRMLVATLHRANALVGLHCCSNTEWTALFELDLDLLSIDVQLSLDAVLEHRAAFLRYLASGATLSLGIVPTNLGAAYRVPELVESVEASLRSTLPRGLSYSAVASQMPLTPACGLGLRSVVDAERVFDEVRAAQRLMRQLGEADEVTAPGPAN